MRPPTPKGAGGGPIPICVTIPCEEVAMEPLQEGAVLNGRYKIEARVESGPNENLYRVRDQRFATDWAMREYDLTVLPAEHRATAHAAFTAEAERLAPLRHQGMAHLVDHFFEGDRAYVVTEWVDGRSWEALVAEHGGRMPLEMVADLGAKLLDLVHFFHTGYDPVPVRVIGPRTVWVNRDDEIKLYDHGLGMHFRVVSGGAPVYGTPGFIAPEHESGATPDLPMDIYAAGAVLHLAVTGVAPTAGTRMPSDVPPPLARVISKSVDPDPKQRNSDIAELKHDLMAVAEGFAPDATPSAGAIASTEMPLAEASTKRSGGCASAVLLLVLMLFMTWLLG